MNMQATAASCYIANSLPPTLSKCVAAADDDDMSDSDDDEDLDLFGEMTDEEKEAKAKKDAVSFL